MPLASFPTDILPKALVAAGVVWGVANYFLVGPILASRIVRADHLPICEARFRDMAAAAGETRERSLTLPTIDPALEIAADQARRVFESPAMQQLRMLGGGLADQLGFDFEGAAGTALRRIEAGKRAAQEAYDEELAAIKAETASNLANAGSVCGCVGDAAIERSRAEWAIFSGTVSLVRLAPLDRFDEKMAEIAGAGLCEAGKAGAK